MVREGAVKQSLQLQAAALSLAGLDGLAGFDLVAFVAEDERPLGGLAGLLDWRLCGELTRRVKDGLFTGSAGDVLLTVSGGRLPSERIFLFGIGPSASMAGAAPGAWFREAARVVVEAGGLRIATAFPSLETRSPGLIGRALVEAVRGTGLQELVLLHPDPRLADRTLAVAAETFPGVRLA